MPLLHYFLQLYIEVDINIVDITEAIIEEVEIIGDLVSHRN